MPYNVVQKYIPPYVPMYQWARQLSLKGYPYHLTPDDVTNSTDLYYLLRFTALKTKKRMTVG